MSVSGDTAYSQTSKLPPHTLLQLTLHNIKIKVNSKLPIETTLCLEVNGQEQQTKRCPVAYSDRETSLVSLDHLLRIRVDDRTAKRKLNLKVYATKDSQQKLIAKHGLELSLKNKQNLTVPFYKSIDQDAYFTIS